MASVITMLTTYAAWIDGAMPADVVAIQRAVSNQTQVKRVASLVAPAVLGQLSGPQSRRDHLESPDLPPATSARLPNLAVFEFRRKSG